MIGLDVYVGVLGLYLYDGVLWLDDCVEVLGLDL